MTTIDVAERIGTAVIVACQEQGFMPAAFTVGLVRRLIFDPDLTSSEQAAVSDIIAACGTNLTLSVSEWQAIKSDVTGLRAYLGLTSPTNAQTVAATKAIIRVLGAILRS